MKVLILFALFAASQAAVLLHHGLGASQQYRSQDGFGNYAFGYNEGHATGGTFRKEVGNGHGVVAGSYGLRDADGRARVVNYVADAAGFRADINTNEPGVDPVKDPAATTVNKAGIVAAPAHHAVAYAHAPVVHGAAAVHYAGHPVAAGFHYNSVVGHHGLGHHGLGHHGYYHHF